MSVRLIDFYDNPDKWTQRTMARNKSGKPCLPTTKKAASWCVVGAIVLCEVPVEDQQKLMRRIDPQSIMLWNDSCKDFDEFISVIKELNI